MLVRVGGLDRGDEALKLYYCDVLAGRKACAGARHLKAPVEFVYLDLGKGEHKTPQYLALNPNGKVPTLVDGDRTLWECDAILCHMATRTGSDFWPGDAEQQVQAIRWMSWSANHFTRTASELYFQFVIKPRFNLGPTDMGEVETALTQLRPMAAILDDHLAGRRWMVGDGVSVADFSVGATLAYAREANIPVADYPNIARWVDRLNALDGWREPYPAQD